jgi:hypothetical protein
VRTESFNRAEFPLQRLSAGDGPKPLDLGAEPGKYGLQAGRIHAVAALGDYAGFVVDALDRGAGVTPGEVVEYAGLPVVVGRPELVATSGSR